MDKGAIGRFQTKAGPLRCVVCAKEDAFESRRARVWAGGSLARQPFRRLTQVMCWNCGNVLWFG